MKRKLVRLSKKDQKSERYFNVSDKERKMLMEAFKVVDQRNQTQSEDD